MRSVLIDECINPRLAPALRTALPHYLVDTVRDLGWAGQKDQALISRIQDRFDVFLTIDRGFEYEHDWKKLRFGIVVLRAANNQMPSYNRLLATLVDHIERLEPGQITHVRDPDI